MFLMRWRYPVWSVAIFLFLCLFWLENTNTDRVFTCRAKLINSQLSQCGTHHQLDLFMAMKDGEGYLLVSGERECGGEAGHGVNDIIDFTYDQERQFYELHFRKRNTLINDIFPQSESGETTVNLRKLDRQKYLLLSSDDRALMVCKAG